MRRLIQAIAALILILLLFVPGWTQSASTQAVRQARALAIHKKSIDYILFSPDGSLIATSSWDGIVQVWDVNKSELLTAITGSKGGYLLGWSPDGKQLVTTNYFAKSMRVWEAKSGKLLRVLSGYQGDEIQWYWDSAGRALTKLLATGYEAKVEVWDPETNKLSFILDHRPMRSDETMSRWKSHFSLKTLYSPAAPTAFFANDRKTIVTASSDSHPKLWDATTGNLVATLIQPEELQKQLKRPFFLTFYGGYPELSPNTRFVAVGSDVGTQLWDTATGELLHTFKDAYDGFFTPDGKTFATTWQRKPDDIFNEYYVEFKLWDVATGQLKASPKKLYKGASSTYLSPDGKILLTRGGERDKMRLIDLEKLELIAELPVGGCVGDAWFGGGCERPAFSPSGRVLMTQRNGDVKLWYVKTGRLIAELNEARDPAVFSPDGRFLATASKNRKSVTLWEIIDQ